MIHVDLAIAFMIFGLVTFTKGKLHPPSSKSRSAIHRAMTHLIFVLKVGKLRGNMWLKYEATCGDEVPTNCIVSIL